MSLLVTLDEFAEFVRTEAYFVDAHWDCLSPDRIEGGDSILRRLGYRWERRNLPVVGVTWFEADAYCRWRGGRLPLAREAQSRRGSPPNGPPEWCYEWYFLGAEGPDVFPEAPPRKRIAGWGARECAAPHAKNVPVAFRVIRQPLP